MKKNRSPFEVGNIGERMENLGLCNKFKVKKKNNIVSLDIFSVGSMATESKQKNSKKKRLLSKECCLGDINQGFLK